MTSIRSRVRTFLLAISLCVLTTSPSVAEPQRAPRVGPRSPQIVLQPEAEPNDTPVTATPLRFHGTAAVVAGSISPAGDFDYFSFVAPPQSRVWILADSGGTQQPGANSRDTLITLYDTDGTTVLEFDNNDGTGNGGDGTVETTLSSAIAGRSLAASGTYYVRVAGFVASNVINPYSLFVFVTYGFDQFEGEPNDSPGNATDLTNSENFRVVHAAIEPPGDTDYYSVVGHSGDTFLISADSDPERDGSSSLIIELLAADGSTVLLTLHATAGGVAAAESANFVLPDDGIYYVRATSPGGGAGSYGITGTVLPVAGACITTITSALGQDSADYPALHGAIVNRWAHSGIPSRCIFHGCSGIDPDPGLHAYDAYTFFNDIPLERCVTVQVEAPACSGGNEIFVASYGDSFDPANLCLNAVANVGSSPDPAGTFSFSVQPLQKYVIVVSEVNSGAGCSEYTLRVTGTCPSGLVIDAHGGTGTSSNLNGILESGETVLVEPRWRGLTGGPLTAAAANFGGPPGPSYDLVDGFADYGSPADGVVADCFDATDCHEVSLSGARPSAHWDSSFDETPSFGESMLWTLHVGNSFADVPSTDLFYPFIENIFHNLVTGGGACGGYCPDEPALRKQMAVFVLKAKEGPFYLPPPPTGVFADVPVDNPFAPWIEELHRRGVVAGCTPPSVADGSLTYCPDDPVLRQQMAVFLLKTLLGSSYVPPAAAGIFVDVPASSGFAPFIEDLFHRGIAAGCGASKFCPANPNLRKQMAPFLVKTFGLVLYGH